MRAQLLAVGEVVVRGVVLLREVRARLLAHVREQRLEQVLLAGEVIVERAGGAPGRRSDVGDLRVQVAALQELAAGRVLQRGRGARGPCLAYTHMRSFPG